MSHHRDHDHGRRPPQPTPDDLAAAGVPSVPPDGVLWGLSSGERHRAEEALRSLARRTGRPFGEIINLAESDRLGELFDPETRRLKVDLAANDDGNPDAGE